MKRLVSLVGFLCFVMNISPAQDIKDKINKLYPIEFAPGVSVTVRNDTIVQYHSFGLANLEYGIYIDSLTNFRMASVSKQFTALAIFRLIEDGKLGFDTKIRSILSALPLITRDITIGQLLNHSSGIIDYENLIANGRTKQLEDSDVLSYISTMDSLYFDAGSQFRYSNTAYCLLALIVERITNKTYPEAIQTLIFEPLAIRKASVYPTEDSLKRAFGYHPEGNSFLFADQSLTSATKGDGGVYISSHEYSNWLNASNSFFSQTYWDALYANRILVKDNIYYSLGWFVKYNELNEPVIFHSGESTGFHNIVALDPIRNNSIAVFSNRDDLKIADLFEGLDADLSAFELPENLFLWMNKVYMNL